MTRPYDRGPKRRNRNLRTRYGMTTTSFDEMLAQQAGRCAICGEPMFGRKDAAVDHDHDTGRVRGLLCRTCNSGIGKLGDNPDRLRAAIEYLEHFKQEHARADFA